MSPIMQEIIDILAKEQDAEVLAEVLDFYEYIKYKKQRNKRASWDIIEEDEPTEEEKKICSKYQDEEHEFVDFDLLVQELGVDE
jgi:hypothetical protein